MTDNACMMSPGKANVTLLIHLLFPLMPSGVFSRVSIATLVDMGHSSNMTKWHWYNDIWVEVKTFAYGKNK